MCERTSSAQNFVERYKTELFFIFSAHRSQILGSLKSPKSVSFTTSWFFLTQVLLVSGLDSGITVVHCNVLFVDASMFSGFAMEKP